MRHGDKWRELITLAAPVVISKLSFTAMGIVDTAMVGRLGPTAQGAVGIANTYIFTLYVFGLGLIGVINTFVSQNHGAGRPRACGVVLGHGLRLATAIGAVTLIVLLLSAPLFRWSGLSEGVSSAGYAYLFFRVLGLPGVFWYWCYNSYLEGLGETRAPMLITIAANVINAVLDYALIFGVGPIPALGVEGAGIATAISNTFMLVCFLVVVHRRSSPYRAFGVDAIWSPIRWDLVRRMLRIGLPMGIQLFLEIGAFLIFSVMIGWVSDDELAANQVALRVMSVSFMTAWGISVAATTLVGRHQGEHEPELAAAAGRRAILLMFGVTLVCGAVFAAIPRALAGLFTPYDHVASTAATLLYVAAVIQVFDGLQMVSYGALRGAGDTRWPLYVVVALAWGMGVPLVYALIIPAGLGVLGAWLGILALLASQAALLYHRFRSGRWKSMRVVDAVPSPPPAPVGEPGSVPAGAETEAG
ncbi:MAG: MATE family efflux transporter [bacterium]